MTITTLKQARAIAGNVNNNNSKMPGSDWSITPSACAVGSKLVDVKGSTCNRCYAVKIERIYPAVKQGWTSNLDKARALIKSGQSDVWAEAMAFQIKRMADKTGIRFHRWFAAGDLQHTDMLKAIVQVCLLTSDVMHWLPTREHMMVKRYIANGGTIPDNLTIRVSSTMVGDQPVKADNTSTVHAKHSAPIGSHGCPAYQQGGACGDCRACWSRAVPNVSYPLH